mgnify:FL=1
MKTYATLGPACCRADLLTELLDMGLTGFRLNLSHTTLAACRPWLSLIHI